MIRGENAFRSRVLLGILVLALAIVSVGTSFAIPPPGYPTTLQVLDNGSGGCAIGTTPDPSHPLDRTLRLWNGSSSPATIYQRDGFWTKSLKIGGEGFVLISGAGTYLSACVPGNWGAPLRVRPKAPGSPPTDSFEVTWAGDQAPAVWRFTIQFRIGSGGWKFWRVKTALKHATFQGAGGKVYFFRARTINPSSVAASKRTDWSPLRRVST